MAVSNEDLARLVVTLEVSVVKALNALQKAQVQTNKTATVMEKRLTDMSQRVDKTFANLGQRMASNITGPLAAIGAAFSTREIIKYADTWTEAGNRIRAAGEIVGMQGRPLQEIRQLADESRAGFNETIQLYARLLRSAGNVANSELEIAKATELVNKAFKAGGAATSEMNAGILQLSQGLSSGFLQGDELRSVRENAPVLAQVIADYFGVTIGGLKALGAEGKLVSEEVFKAILSGEKQIGAAFATTNRTIADSFRLIENALIQYIGNADSAMGATAMISQALTTLADNFDTAADVALKFAAIIAGAILGRSLVAMVGTLANAVTVLFTLRTAMAAAAAGSLSFGAALSTAIGPLSIIIGGAAALAFQHFASESAVAASNLAWVEEETTKLGLSINSTAKDIREAAKSTSILTEETKKLREAERLREVERARSVSDNLRGGNLFDNMGALFGGELTNAVSVANRTVDLLFDGFNKLSDKEREVVQEIKRLAEGLRDATIPAQTVVDKLLELQQEPVGERVIGVLDQFDKIARDLRRTELLLAVKVDTTDIDEARDNLTDYLDALSNPLSSFPLSDDLKAELDKIAKEFDGSKESADEIINKIIDLAETNPDLSPFINQLLTLSNAFASVSNNAAAANAEASSMLSDKQFKDTLSRQANNYVSELGKRGEGAQATINFLKEQERLLTLTEEELKLEEEIAKVRKEADKEGANPTDGRIQKLAEDRIALIESYKKTKDDASKSEKAAKERQDFLKDIENQRIENELIKEEIEFMKTLNPLSSEYNVILAAYRKEQEALLEARRKGIELGPDELQLLKDTALAEARINEEREKSISAQEKLVETTQEWLDVAKSALRSIIDDLIEGKSAGEAFGSALQQIGNHLLSLGLDTIFGKVGGDTGIASLFNGILKREGGGPVRAGEPYIVGEKRPEVFVPTQSGVIIPKVPNSFGSENTNVPISISIDAKGADQAGIARLQAQLNQLKAEIPSVVKSVTQKRVKKGW